MPRVLLVDDEPNKGPGRTDRGPFFLPAVALTRAWVRMTMSLACDLAQAHHLNQSEDKSGI